MMKFVRMLYPRNVMTSTNRSAKRLQRLCKNVPRAVPECTTIYKQNCKPVTREICEGVDQYLKPECRNVVHQECKDEPREDCTYEEIKCENVDE